MRLSPDAPDVVANAAGDLLAVADAEQLRLVDVASRADQAHALLGGAADVGFVDGDRLLTVVRGDDRTQLSGYALPSLELIASLELEGRLRALAFVGTRALVATESLEQPRIVAITSKILIEPIPLREPLQLAAAAPEDRLLVASRTREAQLECWDPLLRRALFRLNLPLPSSADAAGFAARRRLLWLAGGNKVEIYRFSDGRLQARVDMGAPVVGAAGHPDSPRVVFATRPKPDTIELVELDLQLGERRELTTPVVPVAFAVVEGAAPSLVLAARGALTWMELSPAMPGEAARATQAAKTKAVTATANPAPRRDEDWRARLASSAPSSSSSSSSRTATAVAKSKRTEEPRGDGSWRDRLCDWVEGVLAAPRRGSPLPSLPPEATASLLTDRLALDARAARALALLYGARLLGDGDGLAPATVARALGDGEPCADADWDEALARGLLGQLGVAAMRNGKLRLTEAAARFLDGAAPRLTLLVGGAGRAELPAGNVRVDGGARPLADVGAELAERYGYDVALVRVERRRELTARLAEARMHGAWPVVDAGKSPSAWIDGLDDGPTVIVVRGEAHGRLARLPSL